MITFVLGRIHELVKRIDNHHDSGQQLRHLLVLEDANESW